MKTKFTFLATVTALAIFATTSAFASDCGCSGGKKGDKKEDGTKDSATISLKL